jgi:hypothetical protein
VLDTAEYISELGALDVVFVLPCSISGGVTETAKAAASPWHRSSRGTDLARPGGLSVPRDASSSRALSLLFDQSEVVPSLVEL